MKTKTQKTPMFDQKPLSKKSQIGKVVTFPDTTSYPITAIFDVWNDYTQVLYFIDNLQQIVWVPNNFISND